MNDPSVSSTPAPPDPPDSARDVVIEAKGLVKRYGDFTAVNGIDFAVQRGECFGFLGPNGAGKTTTMRMIYCASPVTAGSLKLLGMEVADTQSHRDVKARIGVIPQEDNLDQELTVRENLEVFCRFHGIPRRQARARVAELLDFAQLTEKADAKTLFLSGGMKRRLMVARGLIGEPSIVVLDEPTTGLDPAARQNLWDRLFDLKRRQATLLLTTHYMDEAEQLCDRLVIMDRGKIVATGTPRELIGGHVASHVVELHFDPAVGLPPVVDKLKEKARRVEHLRSRLLLYTDEGDALIAQAAHELPDAEALLRRATLEDVFLKITGRELID